MGVRVDEARRCDPSSKVDLLFSASTCEVADARNAIALNTDVAALAGLSRAIDDGGVSDQ